MPAAYSADIRGRVSVESGSSRCEAAEEFDVSASSAIKWVAAYRTTGSCPRGHWKTITFVAALSRLGMRASQTSSGSMLLVRHPRESTGQRAYLWLKWTLKEKDPELTSARGSYRQLPQLGRVDKLNPDSDAGKQHEGGEALDQLVVAGGDTA